MQANVSFSLQHSSIAHQPLLLRHEGVRCKLQLTDCDVQAEGLSDAALEVAGTGGCQHRVQVLGQRLQRPVEALSQVLQ